MPARKVPLGELADIFAGIPTKGSNRKEIGRSGNVLTVRSLTGMGLDLDQLETHRISARDESRHTVRPGDVLISSRSTTLKTGVVPEFLEGKLINSTLIGVRCFASLPPRLLVAWLESPDGQAEIEAVSQSGTSQMNVTVAGLSRLEVPLLDVAEQHRLNDLLLAADEAYQAEIEAAELRRKLSNEVVISQLRKANN